MRSLASYVLVFLALSIAQTNAFAQLASFSRTDLPFLGNNHTLADVNGDGRLDLAVSINDPATMLSILTGNRDGTFNFASTVGNTSKADTPAIVATDLDNDGRLDLVFDLATAMAPSAHQRVTSDRLRSRVSAAACSSGVTQSR